MNILRGNTKGFLSRQRKDVQNLQKLISTAHNKQTINTARQLVRNLSQCKLTDTESNILGKGLYYAVTPNKIPYEDFIWATELACQTIHDQGKKAESCNVVAGILKTEQHHKRQQHTRKTGRHNHTASKGRTTVILDRDKYTSKIEELLKDSNTYKILKKDPTEQIKKTLKALLKPQMNDNKKTKEAYNHLVPTATITPSIYSTPKPSLAHCRKYRISHVQPFKISKTLQTTLKKQVKVEPDEILISHVSLFHCSQTPR